MRVKAALLLSCCCLPLIAPARRTAVAQLPRDMVRIEGGSFRPLYAPAGSRTVHVESFAIDTVPVSIASFLHFVRNHPGWAPGRVPAGFADGDYLKNVKADAQATRRPIAWVSWPAADTYCRARGARLPTTAEWEFLARADENDRNAAARSEFKQRALELVLAADPPAFLIGSGLRNVWGVRDLHGGLLEWTHDFRSAFGDAGAHGHDHQSGTATCASGTVQTGDASDYAAFLRYAFRAAAKRRVQQPATSVSAAPWICRRELLYSIRTSENSRWICHWPGRAGSGISNTPPNAVASATT